MPFYYILQLLLINSLRALLCTLLPRLGETSRYQTDKKLLYQLISEISSGLTRCEEAGDAGQLTQCRTALQVSSLSYNLY